VLVQGPSLLHPERAVFDAMLAGWAAQQRSRLLAETTVLRRERIVRRFAEFSDGFPWTWTAVDMEDWTSALLSRSGHSHTTIRSYQAAVACFLDYVVDARYGWAAECEARFGTHPVQVCHKWNIAVRVADYEGRPGRRPFTRTELQAFFDFADAQVAAVRAASRKGWLAAFRDATLFKVTYAWGCDGGRQQCLTWPTSAPILRFRSWVGSAPWRCATARRCAARHRDDGRWPR
jgi:integrase/recombinase XerC